MTTEHSKLVLTERDRELLHALVEKVRLLGLRQIAAHWWHDETANARRRLRRLTTAGLVERITVRVRPLPPIQQPIVTWRPGADEPGFGPAAHQLQSRWRKRPVRSATAYIATHRTSQLFGGRGRGRLKQAMQATHDLGVAAVWLRLRQQAPEWADAWRSEDLLAHTRCGEKLPDAFLVNESGDVVCVVEFGGGYDAARVRELHEDCADRGLPYQIW